MMKKYIAAATAALMLFALSACGGKDTTPDNKGSNEATSSASESSESVLPDTAPAGQNDTDVAAAIQQAAESAKAQLAETENTVTSERDSKSEEVTSGEQEAATAAEPTEEEPAAVQDVTSANGLRPEFKDAMDSYEAFYGGYCDFLKKFNANPTDAALITEYTSMMSKLNDCNKDFQAWKDKDLNNAETKYYLEVNNRISQKMVEASQAVQ